MPNGPGWIEFPELYYELSPPPKDTGMFWLTKAEFFRYFPTIYLCAFNMTRLKDSEYENDLKDEIVRRGPTKSKPVSQVGGMQRLQPWVVNKESDPNSRYKIVEDLYDTSFSFQTMNKRVVEGVSIPEGVEEFRANPEKYLAIHYQNSIVEGGWPIHVHQFTFIYREGTKGIRLSSSGTKRTMLTNVLK